MQTARQAPQTRGGTRDTTTEDRQRSGRTPHGRDDGTDDDDCCCTALRLQLTTTSSTNMRNNSGRGNENDNDLIVPHEMNSE